MPDINGVTVTTELEEKLMTALSSLYKMTYYYFRKASTVSEEVQAKRVITICRLLDSIDKEFNPPIDPNEEHDMPEEHDEDTPTDPVQDDPDSGAL